MFLPSHPVLFVTPIALFGIFLFSGSWDPNGNSYVVHVKSAVTQPQCYCTMDNVTTDMCYRPFMNANHSLQEEGKPFPCELVPILNQLERLEPVNDTLSISDLVLVTYGSSTFFKQMIRSIRAWRKFTKTNKFIVYDIGLRQEQVAYLESFNNLEMRTIDFTRYPPHVAVLGTKYYSFKGAVVFEAYLEFEFFLFLDSSIEPNNKHSVRRYINAVAGGEFAPISNVLSSGQTNTEMTHFGTYSYLPIRKYLNDRLQRQAGQILVLRSELATKVIKWYSACSFTANCIAPVGAFNSCPTHRGHLKTICHRYDQSVLNIVMRNALDEAENGKWFGSYEKNNLNRAFVVNRDPTRYDGLEAEATATGARS